MIRTVKFDDFDSWLDYHLVRTSTTIGQPEPKTNTVEVEGSDGVLDFTEYFGEVFYKNRTISLEFQTQVPVEEFPKLFSRIQNDLHGRSMRIKLSEDPEFYYVGRVSVSEWKSNGRIGQLTIEADCEPYKYRAEITRKEFEVDGSAIVYFENLRKRVVPTFTFGAEMSVAFDGATYAASAGRWSDPRLAFGRGLNEVTFTGTGPVAVEYQERGL